MRGWEERREGDESYQNTIMRCSVMMIIVVKVSVYCEGVV